MTTEQAEVFASEWIDAWNAHDLDRILSHYSEDVVFRSPFAVRLVGTPSGVVEGLDALRTYFARGLEAYPDLHFEPISVLAGAGSIALRYTSVNGLEAIETLELDRAGKIRRAAAHYSVPPPSRPEPGRSAAKRAGAQAQDSTVTRVPTGV